MEDIMTIILYCCCFYNEHTVFVYSSNCRCDPLPRQLWKIFLLGEGPMDHISLLALDGNQLHLPVEGKRQLFERAVKVMQKISTKVNVCLYWNRPTPVCQSLCELLLEAWPHINSLRYEPFCFCAVPIPGALS